MLVVAVNWQAANAAPLPVECGTHDAPCVVHVQLDDEQDARLDELKGAGVLAVGVVLVTQLTMLIGSWGRR